MKKETKLLGLLTGTLLMSLAAAAVEFGEPCGIVKPVNGVGQPPTLGLDNTSLFHYLKEAGVPYARLHDVGGPFGKFVFADIPNLFRDFDADETKAENYDFFYTDILMKALVENGVEPYFRLGVTIENAAGHGGRAYRIFPPKDYAKWARICEHVIRHYTEGWADGFKMKISHWEIWNEPDSFETLAQNMMWKAPFEEYVRFYEVASKHLKTTFPHLKVGGYASCGFYGVASSWGRHENARVKHLHKCFTDFLAACRDRRAPLDFFSFHCYDFPEYAEKQIAFCRKTLDDYGFKATEMSLNEWLPCRGGSRSEQCGTAKQAANVAGMLAVMQNGAVDDAEIYDARATGGAYAPLFEPDTLKPRKAYLVYLAFNELRKLGKALPAPAVPKGTFACAAADGQGRCALLIANPTAEPVPFDFTANGYEIESAAAIDATRDYELSSVGDALGPESVWLVRYRRAGNAAQAEPPKGAVFNVADFGAKSSDRLMTAELQAAIDACWQAGGGEVRVPAGTYLTGSLRLRSKVTLHLLSGAVLEGSRNPEDYFSYRDDKLEPLVEWPAEKRPKARSCYPYSRWNNGLIRAFGARDITIVGEPHSYIDGMNCYDEQGEEGYRGPHAVNLWYCTNVVLRGYTIRNSANWAHAIQNSAKIDMRGVTVLGGHDGFDVRTCDDVTVMDCTFRTGDDAIAGFDNVGVRVRNCIFDCACNALRFGGTDVVIENCTGVSPASYGHRYRMDQESKRQGVNDGRKTRHNMGPAFNYYCDHRAVIRRTPGNILLRNCTFANPRHIFALEFDGKHQWCCNRSLESIRFEDCTFTGVVSEPLRITGDAKEPLTLEMKNCTVVAAPEAKTRSFALAKRFRKLVLENVTLGGYAEATVVSDGSGEVVVKGGTPVREAKE